MGQAEAVWSLTYGEPAIRDIYDVGVPRDAKVVDVRGWLHWAAPHIVFSSYSPNTRRSVSQISPTDA
ncbi:MAG: hypothetical protein GY906_36100 [bacterium]|nr:hypothetical protein [bacterium]